MVKEAFIANIADIFEEVDSSTIDASTHFKDLDEWSSIIALSIIAMVDEEYNVLLNGNDIRSSVTVEDLFNLVNSRKG